MAVAAKQPQWKSHGWGKDASAVQFHTPAVSPTLTFLSTGTSKQLQQEIKNKHAPDVTTQAPWI